MNARKKLHCCEHSVGRMMDVKGHSDEVSDGSEGHIIRNQGKVNPVIK